MKKWIALAAIAAAAVSCTDTSGPPAPVNLPAPRAATQSDIAGSYIVTLRSEVPSVDNAAADVAGKHGGKLRHTYKSALKGFSLENISDAEAIAIAHDPRVLRIEADQVVTASGTTQTVAPWGLDRIDQGGQPLSGTYTYSADGSGVSAYIIDTGINYAHVDFGGRAAKGIDVVTAGGTAADCLGHGTHVAGIIGGTTYGVAKNVRLYSVRVLDCQGSGTLVDVLAGIDWVTSNHVSPAVANMSLGGGYSISLNQAVANSVAAGVTYVVSAGNRTDNACNWSPGSEPTAITVGATSSTDSFAPWSNFGSCVDINAPGVSVTSDWYTSNTATNTISGTSMASPHVAGAAALYLSANPTATPAQVASALTSNASANKLGITGTPDLLVYMGFIASPPPPPPTPSTARFTYKCSKLTCTFDGHSSVAATDWSWSFGDGATGSGERIGHAFAAKTNYIVTLNTTPAGLKSKASRTIKCGASNCS